MNNQNTHSPFEQPRKPKQYSLGILVIVIVTAVLTLTNTVILAFNLIRSDSTSTSSKTANLGSEIKISELTKVDNQVYATITNPTSMDMEGISVNVLCYGRNHQYIDCKSIYISYLPSGERVTDYFYLFDDETEAKSFEILDVIAYEYGEK